MFSEHTLAFGHGFTPLAIVLLFLSRPWGVNGGIIVYCPRSLEEVAELRVRDAVGCALVELGEEDEDVVVLTADVARSTRASYFGSRFPERFVNVGIAEQDLVGFASGLALAGKKPYALAFAMFMMRAWEQIRNTIDRMNLNVKLIATHSGFSDHGDGSSHHSLEDLALMRVLHNMVVVVPADSLEAYHTIKLVHQIKGPVYIRIGRDYSPKVASVDDRPELGRLRLLREGEDAAIVGVGPLLAHALEAARLLEEKHGLRVAVANLYTLKPVDVDGLVKLAQKTGRIFVVEEHFPRGGVFGVVAEVLAQHKPVPVYPIAARGYGHSARSVMDLYEAHGLTPQAIARRVLEVVRSAEQRV